MKKMRERTFTGQKTPERSERELAHGLLAREAAAESFVLLKNEGGLLPLEAGSRVAVYGAGAMHTVKGGTGSGDVNERESVSVLQGLRNAGFVIANEAWLDTCEEIYRAARERWRAEVERELELHPQWGFFHAYTSHPFETPCGAPVDEETARNDGADTALFVISRVAGEAKDRKYEPGDYLPAPGEEALLEQLCRCYRSVCVIINSGGVIDLSFTDRFENLAALLLMGQAGQEGGNALADVLCGRVTPSGKLADTWAYRYADYPSAGTFSYESGDLFTEEYREGIYVGYRYFDTFGIPARFGFGFGLSYTSFEIGRASVKADAEKVTVTAPVKNTGACRSGKEVLQVYVSCPQGRLLKERRRLCGFAKTKLLAPGEEQLLTVTFPMDAMASFDEEASAYVLEAGSYILFAGNSLESSAICGSVTLPGTVELLRCEHICPLQKPLKEREPDRERLLRLRAEDEAQLFRFRRVCVDPDGIARRRVSYAAGGPLPKDEAAELVEQMDKDTLIRFATGNLSRDPASNLGTAGQAVPGAAAQTTACGRARGIADIVLADGPAGLRLTRHYFVKNGEAIRGYDRENMENGFFAAGTPPENAEDYYQFCTAIPTGALLAQCWDTELIRRVGAAVGREMTEYEVTLWLAPGMNIHRNPLCGRNFEYYSEDPLLAGTCAAAMTGGVQSVPGCGTTVKHFACNNQEDNRLGSDSVVSERALREIYLKNFEIAVKTAQPMSIMTSYNMINGVHAANSYDLCTKAARCEWGFAGAIMTDWSTTTASRAGECTASGCMRAGNDMIMPGAVRDHEDLARSLENGTLSLDELKRCVYRNVRLILRSNQYEDAEPYRGKE